jgi:hypothetical protein
LWVITCKPFFFGVTPGLQPRCISIHLGIKSAAERFFLEQAEAKVSRRKFTTEELKEFSLENYTCLSKFSYAQWRDLILHRSALWHFTDLLRSIAIPSDADLRLYATALRSYVAHFHAEAGTKSSPDALQVVTAAADDDLSPAVTEFYFAHARALAANLAASLLDDPLGSFPFSWPADINSATPLETSFIKLVPQDYKGPPPPHADVLSGELYGTLDGVPQNQPFIGTDPTSRRALLEIDLGQDDSLLLADFTKWLRQWRHVSADKVQKKAPKEKLDWVQTEIGRWLNRPLIPYIDLKLVARLIGKDFGAGMLEALLHDNSSPDDWETVEEWLEDHRTTFLSEAWLDVMFRMAFEENRQGGKNSP